MSIAKDPLYMIVSGVGGQGNILISRLIGRALIKKGYGVTMVDTFGAAQRGGAVNTNLRISETKSYETLIPHGQSHIVVGLEPLETLRMLTIYGNPGVLTLTNINPVFPLEVLAGEAEYPEQEELGQAITKLSKRVWFMNATDLALKLGNIIVANTIMLGALLRIQLLPLAVEDIENEIRESLPQSKVYLNLRGLKVGYDAVR